MQPLPFWAVKMERMRHPPRRGRRSPPAGPHLEGTTEMAIWLHLGVLAVEMAVYAMFAWNHVVPTPVGYAIMALCKLVSIGLLVLDMSRRNGTSRSRVGS